MSLWVGKEEWSMDPYEPVGGEGGVVHGPLDKERAMVWGQCSRIGNSITVVLFTLLKCKPTHTTAR